MGLTLTGGGDPRSGNGAAAVLYAVVAASAVAAVLWRLAGVGRSAQIEETFIAGCGRFMSAAALVLLALTLGQMIKDLGTGAYVAGLFAGSVPRALFAPLIFVVGAFVSFATGTSYGTFSIMTPIAIPLAHTTGADPHLLFGACLAGGIFGDNCSPISDTSIVTSIATQTTVVDHVTTQLPYALVAAGLATIGFCLLGAWMA
jgi:Na+/H+ antiporter NhaC